MKLIIFSTIPGINIKKSLNDLKLYVASKKIKSEQYCIEEYFSKYALKYLNQLSDSGDKEPSVANIYSLPFSQMIEICDKAFKEMLLKVKFDEKKRKIKYAFISFHPILFSQQTSEFYCPYMIQKILRALKKYKYNIEKIISLHDDIYDIYYNLLFRGQLFNPEACEEEFAIGGWKRNPLKEVKDLLQILNWRDRELTYTRNLSKSIETKHFLLHKKGRMKTIWKIINNHPCVYLSHPISQPRRDITNSKDKQKCLQPDSERGQNLIKEIQDFADCLGKFVPLVEPTCIDEYRINMEKIEKLKENDLINRILPPLTERWTLPQQTLFGGINIKEDKSNGLIIIKKSIYDVNKFKFSRKSLKNLKNSLEILLHEIKRQINVRDHILTQQANLVIAFKPFSLPNSPDPTGGVEEEIDTLLRKKKLGGNLCQPYLIIINSKEDEVRRMLNVLAGCWEKDIAIYFKHLNDKMLDKLYLGIKDIINQEAINKDLDNVKDLLNKLLERYNISPKRKTKKTSMPKGSLKKTEEIKEEFLKVLISESTIFQSPLESMAKTNQEDMQFIYNIVPLTTFVEKVNKILLKGKKDSHKKKNKKNKKY